MAFLLVFLAHFSDARECSDLFIRRNVIPFTANVPINQRAYEFFTDIQNRYNLVPIYLENDPAIETAHFERSASTISLKIFSGMEVDTPIWQFQFDENGTYPIRVEPYWKGTVFKIRPPIRRQPGFYDEVIVTEFDQWIQDFESLHPDLRVMVVRWTKNGVMNETLSILVPKSLRVEKFIKEISRGVMLTTLSERDWKITQAAVQNMLSILKETKKKFLVKDVLLLGVPHSAKFQAEIVGRKGQQILLVESISDENYQSYKFPVGEESKLEFTAIFEKTNGQTLFRKVGTNPLFKDILEIRMRDESNGDRVFDILQTGFMGVTKIRIIWKQGAPGWF